MLKFKSSTIGDLYKYLILIVLGIFIINLFAFFPTSKAIYALTKIDNSSIQNQTPSLASEGILRDYKIPDEIAQEDDELFLNNLDANSKNTGNNGKSSFKGKRLVVIDAGHGGIDPGSSSPGLDEKDISLDIALKTNSILIGKGVTTLLTRKSDIYVPLKDRIDLANNNNAVLFLSIHCNSFTDPSLRGILTLYYPSTTLSSGGLFEKPYAEIMQNELVQDLGAFDIGLAERPNLAVLHQALMPSVIVELGFLTNKSDLNLLSSQAYRQTCANALAKGIIHALEK